MQSPSKPSASQSFPIPHVRESPEETQSSESVDSGKSSRKVSLESIREPKDPLTALPLKKHRYVTDSGKLVQDNRYTIPLAANVETKQPRRKPPKTSKTSKTSKASKAPKCGTKRKQSQSDELGQPDELETVDTSLECL